MCDLYPCLQLGCSSIWLGGTARRQQESTPSSASLEFQWHVPIDECAEDSEYENCDAASLSA